MTVLYTIMQLTWGLPQTLAGFVVFILNIRRRHYLYHGSVVTVWNSKSSLSLGLFTFISEDPFFYYPACKEQYDYSSFSRMLLVHEYGHTIQSLIFGPLYLLAVGVPSVAWSFVPCFVDKRAKENISYFSAYPERWANKLGEKVTKDVSIGEPV